jgi:nitrile hydratase accessory protein
MRNIVTRDDGSRVHVARTHGQLFVCADGCCCGRTQDGYAPVPRDLYHEEWQRRGLRSRVHLTIGGCLGPCALANVVMLLFAGRQAWFHSIATDAQVLALYDWIEAMTREGVWSAPPPALAAYHFTASTWEPRLDGKPVDDRHLRAALPAPTACGVPPSDATPRDGAPTRLVGELDGPAAVPRRNGELVFAEPWEARVFGMTIALHEQRIYGWDEFQRRLIAEIADAEARGEHANYYERWLAGFERLLADKGLLAPDDLEDRTEAFEFGERDDVY